MHLHFIGIGGIGMSGLAGIALQLGYRVSGSDLRENQLTKNLQKKGATFYLGHCADQVKDADLVVFSSAINKDNPEIREAKIKGIPTISRGQFVADLTNPCENIVVAGTHGKTTTTALICELLLEDKRDPTILIGGVLKRTGVNSRWGSGGWAVVESDESDGSFLLLHPSIAVITNIEDDHLEHYLSQANILQAFSRFLKGIKPGGVGIVNIDNEGLQHILKKGRIKRHLITYGLRPGADISAQNIHFGILSSSFKVRYKGKIMGKLEVPLSGMHNIHNCLAAAGVGIILGISWKKIKEVFSSFKGVKRRLERVGQVGSVSIFDDYAHHPTEIKATLQELKRFGQRLIVIFQPHRYTRTALLLSQFSTSFAQADVLVLTEIYPAGEAPIPGINGQTLFKLVRKKRSSPTYYIPSQKKIIEFLKNQVKKDDLILTLGAGDITQLSTEIIKSGISCGQRCQSH